MPTTTVREAVVRYRGRRQIAETVRDPADVARFVRGIVQNDAREHFVVLMLDGRHRPIGYQVVSVGTATASLVHPRDVFRPAVLNMTAGLIFVHNHPSGDPEPSKEDMSLTRRLAQAGELLGIRVLDHVIIGAKTYYSLADNGVL